MTKSERCDLIERVACTVYDATESFEEKHIGEHLAYLLWEIARSHKGDTAGLDLTEPRSRAVLELFADIFSAADVVWNYIVQPDKRHFVVSGHVPFGEFQMIACVAAVSPRQAVRTFTEGWLYEGETMPHQWWELDLNPKTGEDWCIIDGVIEINGPPITIHADHEINGI